MPIEDLNNLNTGKSTTKKVIMLIARLVVIALCCFASYNLGKSKATIEDNKKDKEEEKEKILNDIESWKTKYIYMLKTSYCPTTNNTKLCYYGIFDINNDQIPELFIETGSNVNPYELDIYTIRNNEVVKLAHTPFESSTLKYSDNDLYIDWRDSNKQIVYKLKIENNQLVSNEIYNAQNIDVDGEYKSNTLDITKLDDYSIIENYK